MSHQSSARLLVAQIVRLRGVADAEAIAAITGLARPRVEAELQAMAESDLVETRNGRVNGFSLTPEGSFILRSLLEAELGEGARRAEVEAAYDSFLEFNHELLRVCTAWQLRCIDVGKWQPNDHADPDYDAAVIAELEQVHERVTAVIDRLASVLQRFALHRPRLQNALERLRSGDHDYFTKPLIPSYHSCWFELHEDLLATLGRERRTERSLP